jgi:hypothetical protein
MTLLWIVLELVVEIFGAMIVEARVKLTSSASPGWAALVSRRV